MSLAITSLQESPAVTQETALGLTVGEMVRRYFEQKNVAIASADTKRAYRYEMERLQKFVGEGAPVDALNRFSLHAFARELHQKGLAVATRRRALSCARNLVKWAHSAGIYAENFALTLKLPRLPKRLPQVPSEAQVQAMLDSPPATSWPERDQCIAQFFYCSPRVFEVAAINMEDISGDKLRVHGKGRRERIAFLTPAAKAALSAYLPAREVLLRKQGNEISALFVNRRGQRITVKSIHRIVKALAHAAGLPEYVSPVKLRAACATHSLSRGAPLSAVSQLLGHEKITSTMYYVGAVSPKRMRESYDNAFKR
jgi:integrase/recombinase XerC